MPCLSEDRVMYRHGNLCARAMARLAAAAAGLLLALGVPATPAVADTCANAALRAQNNSLELPDCRAYEMVTPSYKEGFTLAPQGFTDDGSVAFYSTGNFAGNGLGQAFNQYVASRSPGGWFTTAMNPPGEPYDALLGLGADALSADLRSALFLMRTEDQPDDAADYYIRRPNGAFTRVASGAIPGVVGSRPWTFGASADLSHVIFGHGSGIGSAESSALWEYVGINEDGPPRRVSIDNDGLVTQGQTCLNKISADGRVIAFTSGCAGSGVLGVWARVGGSATVDVSGSECTRTPSDPGGACNARADAVFAGAAVDGSRIFFTTAQQLKNGDTDQTSDLYACDLPPGSPAPVGTANPCASLTQISDVAGGAQVDGVAAMSEDGSRVYFVAEGAALASNLGTNGAAPVAGRPNLYLWSTDAAHPAGTTRFVTQLDSNDLYRSQATSDGRYLVISTASGLVTSGPGADTDGARDMYRYDEETDTMKRLSTSVSGAGGDDPAFGATPSAVSGITPDGSTVVFETSEGLSPSDIDGVIDVYAWHEGKVSLISRGGGGVLGITRGGRDIYFTTDNALTAADGDVNGDIYDARIDGGFDLSRPAPCSGDACRGQQSGTPSLSGPVASPAGEDGKPEADPVVSLRTVSAAQRKRLAATGKVTLTITANTPGTVNAIASATLGGRSATVASGRRTMVTPGTVAVALQLSKRARAQLAAKGKLTVRLVVSHSRVALSRSATLNLTKGKKAARRARALHAAAAAERGR
jgi:Tol biopolymer transport system component